LAYTSHKIIDSYILAVTPNKEVSDKVDEYRSKYRKRNYSICPHITILPPFYIDNVNNVEVELSEKLKNIHSREIVISSIGFFENGNDENVIYFKLNKGSESYLREIFSLCFGALQGQIKNKYSNYPTEYNPHITISSKILDIDFPEIKAELINTKTFFRFEVISIDIYKQEQESGVWNKIKVLSIA